MTPKTYTKTTETVDAVINCAAEFFRKYGYRKTTVDDISSHVRISKKPLYSIFSSKEAILREATWRETTETVHTFYKSFPSHAHPDALLLSLCRFIFTDRIKQGKNGVFWGIHADDNYIRTSYLDALKRVIKDIYDDGSRIGIFKPINPFFATEAVVSILIAALDSFHKTTKPVIMFNDALTMIADSIAFKYRIVFDKMS